jgi:hypothetical protein
MSFMVSKPSYALFSEHCDHGRGIEFKFINSESMIICGNEWSHSQLGTYIQGNISYVPVA